MIFYSSQWSNIIANKLASLQPLSLKIRLEGHKTRHEGLLMSSFNLVVTSFKFSSSTTLLPLSFSSSSFDLCGLEPIKDKITGKRIKPWNSPNVIMRKKICKKNMITTDCFWVLIPADQYLKVGNEDMRLRIDKHADSQKSGDTAIKNGRSNGGQGVHHAFFSWGSSALELNWGYVWQSFKLLTHFWWRKEWTIWAEKSTQRPTEMMILVAATMSIVRPQKCM